jgi:hypothetical protein
MAENVKEVTDQEFEAQVLKSRAGPGGLLGALVRPLQGHRAGGG